MGLNEDLGNINKGSTPENQRSNKRETGVVSQTTQDLFTSHFNSFEGILQMISGLHIFESEYLMKQMGPPVLILHVRFLESIGGKMEDL